MAAVCDNGGARMLANEPLSLMSLEEIEEETPKWLINEYMPMGQICLLAGCGGVGKTSIWTAIAASISDGRKTFLESSLPDEAFSDREPRNVLYFSSEDSSKVILKPRLRNNNARMENLYTMDISDKRFKEITFDSPILSSLIEKYRPALVIFDPIQGFLSERVEMSSRNAMRHVLTPLIGYGEKYETTFLIICHTNKQAGVWGRKRIADSSDLWDIARSVMLVGETKDKGIFYISHEKSNYGITGKTVLFSLHDGVINFEGYSGQKDQDYVMTADFSRRCAPAQDAAKKFIMEYLQDGELREVTDVDEAANVRGISKTALRKAKSELNKSGEIQYTNKAEGHAKGVKHFLSITNNQEVDGGDIL